MGGCQSLDGGMPAADFSPVLAQPKPLCASESAQRSASEGVSERSRRSAPCAEGTACPQPRAAGWLAFEDTPEIHAHAGSGPPGSTRAAGSAAASTAAPPPPLSPPRGSPPPLTRSRTARTSTSSSLRRLKRGFASFRDKYTAQDERFWEAVQRYRLIESAEASNQAPPMLAISHACPTIPARRPPAAIKPVAVEPPLSPRPQHPLALSPASRRELLAA